MDISTIIKKLDSYLYDDVLQFVDDVKLIFDNSSTYNEVRSFTLCFAVMEGLLSVR